MIQKSGCLTIAVFILMLGCQQAPVTTDAPFDPALGSIRKQPSENTMFSPVILIPQWHLSPGTLTTQLAAPLPQAENQTAIYRQLVLWRKTDYLKNVVVEGCEGEIRDDNIDKFNGWDLATLKQKLAKGENIDGVMTHVGLKLKARFGADIRVFCGDDLALIKQHQEALSDVRGLLGFKGRIAQFKNDAKKRKDYIETAKSVLKMPKSSKEPEVLARLDHDLKIAFGQFETLIQKRNEVFAKAALERTRPVAIVIGAVHIKGLEELLKDQRVLVFTPKGLSGDEDTILQRAKSL